MIVESRPVRTVVARQRFDELHVPFMPYCQTNAMPFCTILWQYSGDPNVPPATSADQISATARRYKGWGESPQAATGARRGWSRKRIERTFWPGEDLEALDRSDVDDGDGCARSRGVPSASRRIGAHHKTIALHRVLPDSSSEAQPSSRLRCDLLVYAAALHRYP